MIEWIKNPWPWYIGGPLIGLSVPLLLIFGNKRLGVSSSLRHICAICFPGNIQFFKYDWKREMWNLFFVFGIAVGGFLIGFGTRYAGGCTSGHSIMGLSNLQWPSLVATICFMIGGIVMANFILPSILRL